jgi:hypothetical protein
MLNSTMFLSLVVEFNMFEVFLLLALTSLNSTCLKSHRKFLLAIIMSKCLLLMKRKKFDLSYDVSSKHVMGMT